MAGEFRIQNILLPYSTFVEGAAPASPAAGQQRLFFDTSDHKLKRKDSSGTITEVGSTGGGGGGSASPALNVYLYNNFR